MPKRIFRIEGNVINQQGIGAHDLKIELWDKDLIFDDLVGSPVGYIPCTINSNREMGETKS